MLILYKKSLSSRMQRFQPNSPEIICGIFKIGRFIGSNALVSLIPNRA